MAVGKWRTIASKAQVWDTHNADDKRRRWLWALHARASLLMYRTSCLAAVAAATGACRTQYRCTTFFTITMTSQRVQTVHHVLPSVAFRRTLTCSLPRGGMEGGLRPSRLRCVGLACANLPSCSCMRALRVAAARTRTARRSRLEARACALRSYQWLPCAGWLPPHTEHACLNRHCGRVHPLTL